MASRLISQSGLADMAGVSKQAISKRCKKDLAPAMVGASLDLDHALVVAFLRDRGRKAPAPPRAPTKNRKTATGDAGEQTTPTDFDEPGRRAPTAFRPKLDADDPRYGFSPGSPEDLELLGELLAPLIDRFGTDEACAKWMISLREKENIRAKRINNEEAEGSLIPRDFVVTHIVSFLEEASKRLLGDLPKTLVRELFSMAHTGAPHVEGERAAREAVSKHLEAVNKKISKTIRDAARRAAEKGDRADRGAGPLAGGADRGSDNPA